LLFCATPASAGFPVTQRMTCPVGGEQFTFTTTPSYSTWGSRPDGKPYGSWEFPLDLPECPGNRLILYKDFDAPELDRLKALIVKPEYRALAGEAQYYRLHWLMREMGAPALDHLWALLQAGWQVPDESEPRRRYLSEFAAGMDALGGAPANGADFAMRGRWINALRELGRFDEAQALLNRTSTEPLRLPASGGNGIEDAQEWLGYFRQLGTLIGRRDASAEPLDAIPSDAAIALCVHHEERLSQWDRAFCASKAREVEQVRQSGE
jgi:hypothetical protein